VRGEGIRLLMFQDRLEVYSPGRLPGHVTLDNLKDERYSRNEAIVAVLSDLGYIERLGYGVDRMIAAMQEAGLPAPLFEETAAGFRVTLYSAGDALVSPRPEQQRWGHQFLNERQERALAYVQANERITNSEYQELAPDVSAETIRRDLADLVEKNILIRIGSKKATYYILK
jgi:ATP-dependent DNA helicase RecG